ncbi:MAG: branched-chain amino acid ABC transporter permease [Betaproteobacteria bacterium]|jgi:branched-chain amino acid transport system permease protein|nr:branched-chain amino acid ABC transporter permease [Betaproteobacteria bacterium]NBP35807.1 branched-chain amino acid ABC transporter permease [Betaproteobacteria bacterium]NBQ95096.1 branched-chain amino acid ABC transporter permease [Betaproteobacteria bacterium]NBT71693.1 branched-chain amino acid ABC transporter permease [Betaproteobacteria bacterium]NBT81516.1 branched-chain amino acid ABC transporter permease [Betaproteobacteria bacterium]
MDFYLGLAQVIGIHSLLGLSAWCVLHTGQVSLAQGGFFAIGAYLAGMLTSMFQWPLGYALATGAVSACAVAIAIGFPALRIKGLMLVVATTAFAEIIRLFFFNFKWRVAGPEGLVGPDGSLGFGGIRYFPANGWSSFELNALIWSLVAMVMMLLAWLDRSRVGTMWRAIGEDELAAQCAGINLTAAKVSAFGIGGAIAGLAGGIFAHYATHIEHGNFGILLATFAIAYPILGGLASLWGTIIAVIFVQGFLLEGLRFLGEWRSLLFGVLIIVVMIIRPSGLLKASLGMRGRLNKAAREPEYRRDQAKSGTTDEVHHA